MLCVSRQMQISPKPKRMLPINANVNPLRRLLTHSLLGLLIKCAYEGIYPSFREIQLCEGGISPIRNPTDV